MRLDGGCEVGVGIPDGRGGPGFRMGLEGAEDVGDVLDVEVDVFGEGCPHSVFDASCACNIFKGEASRVARVVGELFQ